MPPCSSTRRIRAFLLVPPLRPHSSGGTIPMKLPIFHSSLSGHPIFRLVGTDGGEAEGVAYRVQ